MRRVLLVAALCVGGCASSGISGWSRIDGRAEDPQQLAADQTVCRGEMDKAGLSSNREPRFTIGQSGIVSERRAAMTSVFEGCMAQRGYVAIR